MKTVRPCPPKEPRDPTLSELALDAEFETGIFLATDPVKTTRRQ